LDTGDRTVEHLKITAVKAVSHTHEADDICQLVNQIDCHFQWQFRNCYPGILNCCHGIASRQIGHPVDLHSLASVEIHLSTCSVNHDGGIVL
jgi:hypothetical protein